MPAGCHRVVATLTDYTQDRASDATLLRLLNDNYDEVMLWPQGPGDASYLASLGVRKPSMLEPTVGAFDQALVEPGTAYVGLRLHGGIRAAQLNVPALILSVDNRAREIARSVGLVCPSRHSFLEIATLLRSDQIFDLDIPARNICRWRAEWMAQ